MKKPVALLALTLTLTTALAGCTGATQPTETAEPTETPAVIEAPETTPTETTTETNQPAETTETAPVEEDGQNPLMNFVGTYGAGRPTALVECEGKDGGLVSIYWSSSAWEHTEWELHGTFDPDTLTLTYQNGVRKDVVYSDDGTSSTETVVYENGSGTFVFDGDTMTWNDDVEDMGQDVTFVFCPPIVEEEGADDGYYSAVTALNRETVEGICQGIHDAYLNEDWEALAGRVRYPITVNGVELKDEAAFLTYMAGATVHPSDREEMEKEDCVDLFYNGQGICLGTGQVWLLDPAYMTEDTPSLEIIALSGIVEATK